MSVSELASDAFEVDAMSEVGEFTDGRNDWLCTEHEQDAQSCPGACIPPGGPLLVRDCENRNCGLQSDSYAGGGSSGTTLSL